MPKIQSAKNPSRDLKKCLSWIKISILITILKSRKDEIGHRKMFYCFIRHNSIPSLWFLNPLSKGALAWQFYFMTVVNMSFLDVKWPKVISLFKSINFLPRAFELNWITLFHVGKNIHTVFLDHITKDVYY